jgi:hypothetical protein
MKPITILILIALAGILGYAIEPQLRSQLTGEIPIDKSGSSMGAQLEFRLPGTMRYDLSRIAADKLPKHVTLRNDVRHSDPATGVTFTIKSGTEVPLVAVQKDQAVLRPEGIEYKILIPHSKTDLLERVIASLAATPESEALESVAPADADGHGPPSEDQADLQH